MKIKFISSGIYLIMLLYLAIYLAGFLPFIAENKEHFSPNLLTDYSLNILFHPLKNSILMIEAANPLFYVLTGAALFAFLYFLYKTRNKGYETVSEKYGVQGSSRWAKKSEIFNVKKQIVTSDFNKMHEDLLESITEGEGQ